jgi:hypothetical protein
VAVLVFTRVSLCKGAAYDSWPSTLDPPSIMSSSSIINLDMAPLGESCHKPGDNGQTLRATGQAPYSSKAKNCAECRRLKVKCDRKVYPDSLFLIINGALSIYLRTHQLPTPTGTLPELSQARMPVHLPGFCTSRTWQ